MLVCIHVDALFLFDLFNDWLRLVFVLKQERKIGKICFEIKKEKLFSP